MTRIREEEDYTRGSYAAVVIVLMAFAPMSPHNLARVGPGHCCYRIGPICFLVR